MIDGTDGLYYESSANAKCLIVPCWKSVVRSVIKVNVYTTLLVALLLAVFILKVCLRALIGERHH